MKTFRKNSMVTASVISFMLVALGLTGLGVALAATTPSLGTAATFGILASTYTNTSAGTTVSGDVGFTTGPAVAPAGVHTNYGVAAPYATAGTDQGNALSNLNSQPCTSTFAPGAIDLSTDVTHGPIGVYTPGVYCSTGAMNVGGSLTLNGNGTYIFRAVGALNSTAGAVVTLAGGASACNVFWTPSAATTLAANTTFAGTVIDNAGITVGANTTWSGLALAFGGTVTTDTDTITVPVCVVAPPALATLRVVKQVVNNNGGTATAALFNLHVKLAGADVAGSPAAGTVAPGTSYSLTAGTYVVSEDANASYTQSFSGDCDSSGNVTLASGDSKTCTITNDDVAVVVPPVVPPALAATLNVIKQVVNDNGGTSTASLFNLHVKLSGADIAGSPAVGIAAPGTPYSLVAGTYVVSEDSNASYTLTFSGDCNSSGSVTLIAGDNKTCTVTNNDIAPGVVVPEVIALEVVAPVAALPASIRVVKRVINDNGGTKTVAGFPLFVSGTSVVSGATNVFPAPATYTVTETSNSKYTRRFSGDCNASGRVSLVPGDAKVCTITNNDIAPVVVVQSAAPKLPNTGSVPGENNIPWNIVIFPGVLMLVSTSIVVVLRKRKI